MPCRKRNELRRDADIRRQRTREFAQRNPAYGPTWAAGNRECRRAASRQSYARHREVRREDNRAWEARNPESHKLRTAERRVRLSQDARTVTAKDITKLLHRHSNRCAYCDAKGKLHIDHVVPLSRGGRHAIGNLLPACAACNLSKGASLLAVWKNRRGPTKQSVVAA